MNKRVKLSLFVILAVSMGFAGINIYASSVYGNRTVNFNNWSAWDTYNGSMVTQDFGNYKTLQGDDRLKINANGQLRFFIPKNTVGSSQGGGIIKAEITPKRTYTFEYDIKFDSNFDWGKGGKIPGISGGAGYTACQDSSDGKGFSIRLMWKQNGNIQPYIYHMNKPGNCGDNFSGTNIVQFNKNQTYNIRYWVVMNDPGQKNGIVKIYIDNSLKFEKRDLEFRSSTAYKTDTAHLSVFPGGSDSTWSVPTDRYIYIDNVSWY